MNTLEKKDEGDLKERPLLMSERLIQPTLAGWKRQTRRVIKERPAFIQQLRDGRFETSPDGGFDHGVKELICPYGRPGDLLWVREDHYRYGHWEKVPGMLTKGGKNKWRFVPDLEDVLYDAPRRCRRSRCTGNPGRARWYRRLGRFMPRQLSRITLEIVSVRAERLHAITLEDVCNEGLAESIYDFKPATDGFRAWKELWESINGPGSWDENPFVWVVEFRRVAPKKIGGAA